MFEFFLKIIKEPSNSPRGKKTKAFLNKQQQQQQQQSKWWDKWRETTDALNEARQTEEWEKIERTKHIEVVKATKGQNNTKMQIKTINENEKRRTLTRTSHVSDILAGQIMSELTKNVDRLYY